MKQAFACCVFLLYFSLITANSVNEVHNQYPNCTWENVTEEALKKDKDLRDGKQHILDSEKKLYTPVGPHNISHAFNTTIVILDLQVCEEHSPVHKYNFFWTSEDVSFKCLDKTYCKHNGTLSQKGNCLSYYWVNQKTNYTKFVGVECYFV